MKKLLLLTLLCLGLWACQSQPDSSLTPDKCQQLALCIPDHEMLPSARKYFTPSYLKAWDDIHQMPDEGEYAGMLPDCEWLYYFVTGNGGADNLQAHILAVSEQEDEAYIILYYTCFDSDNRTNQPKHIISLLRDDDEWLIDDFDNTKYEMTEWVQQSITHFQNNLRFNAFSEYIVESGELEEYIKDMKHFIQQYKK